MSIFTGFQKAGENCTEQNVEVITECLKWQVSPLYIYKVLAQGLWLSVSPECLSLLHLIITHPG